MLDRRELCAAVLKDRGDLLVVAGLGASAWDITAIGDTPANFPLWGGMGGAVMIGLGLALAQPDKPVLVITGDGEMLMGVGALATIAHQAPRNLSILVQDNEHYSETGGQQTATRHGTDLVVMAEGAGIKRTQRIASLEDAAKFRDVVHAKGGPIFALAKIEAKNLPLVLPPREGAILQARMREHLLGPSAHLA
ncbi:thiamine pyrophosphate-dependent enzyme [Sabulicella rubraurantiaca]|uniref:thiamine pyrophosphate-dependent enzyme n=1 Tax=Sabulicella rubraurantiaca TaxID=2811429 RepID=UPI001A9796BD|nr:thiamine pyrophosphate-dependent enzyme [Sabulicella rubraurantiaca]